MRYELELPLGPVGTAHSVNAEVNDAPRVDHLSRDPSDRNLIYNVFGLGGASIVYRSGFS